MKVKYKTADGRMEVEFDAKDQLDLLEQLAAFQEIFEGNECYTKDGKTRSNQVRFVHRNVDGNDFYELECTDPNPALRRAKRKFGQHKGARTLFPKGGWVKWNGSEEVEI